MTTNINDPDPTQSRSDADVPERLPVPDNLSPHSRNLPQCVPGTDSGYGSNDIGGSTRAADSVCAESVDVESPCAADNGTRVQDRRYQTIPSQSNIETPVEGAQTAPRIYGPPRPFPLGRRKDELEFDVDPPLNVSQSWRNIKPSLSKGLDDEMKKHGTQFKGALRLAMLGKDATRPADARPVIVAFCPEAQWKRVEKFFKKRKVRDIYRPRSGDPDLPVFDFVLGQPLELKAWGDGVEVFLPDIILGQEPLDPCATLCGTSIQLRDLGSNWASIATLSGIIEVIDATNNVVVYGMTAGHVLPPASTGAVMSWEAKDGRVIGNVVDECLNQHDSEDGVYYDWALSRLPPHCLAPNHLRLQGYAPRQDGGGYSAERFPELHSVDTTFMTALDKIHVVVMTGSGGPKKGWLSTLSCPFMLGPGTEFITAYTVSFPQTGVICKGDSGSWVVNESTLEVIGHIVATDKLGDAYLIPLTDVFADIKTKLGAKSVGLASASSIRSVGLVPGSLNMVGMPQLDAIRGNGVDRNNSTAPRKWAITQPRSEGSDSGYGSTASISTPDSAESLENEIKEVVGLLQSWMDDAIPEDVWFSTGKWIS